MLWWNSAVVMWAGRGDLDREAGDKTVDSATLKVNGLSLLPRNLW